MKLESELYKEVAMDLSLESEEVQADFFNTFFKALRANCGDEFRTQIQISSFTDRLDEESRDRVDFMGRCEGEE